MSNLFFKLPVSSSKATKALDPSLVTTPFGASESVDYNATHFWDFGVASLASAISDATLALGSSNDSFNATGLKVGTLRTDRVVSSVFPTEGQAITVAAVVSANFVAYPGVTLTAFGNWNDTQGFCPYFGSAAKNMKARWNNSQVYGADDRPVPLNKPLYLLMSMNPATRQGTVSLMDSSLVYFQSAMTPASGVLGNAEAIVLGQTKVASDGNSSYNWNFHEFAIYDNVYMPISEHNAMFTKAKARQAAKGITNL